MKKILCPTDFSKASLNAFVYAVNLAKRVGAEIVTIHVYDLPAAIIDASLENLSEIRDITEWDHFEQYKSAIAKLRVIAEENHASHLTLTHILEQGNTVDTVLQAAANNHADLIIMGTHGASGVTEALFGSNTEKIMNRANCRVLAIPAACGYSPLSRILFLSRYEERDKATLRELLAFAALFHARIDVLYITARHTDDEADTIREWKRIFSGDAVDFYTIASDSPEETILDFSEVHHSNLIALTVRHKGLLERLFLYSVARKMVFHSVLPVLSVSHR
ncbi:hypothetical protein HYN48_13060 [Flavobacterium magnum]|uniref:UspA domain-containing protein n=1 Tax=Flavobacterium magnum TaxID=2162713 RepID=A0A2S0RI84_9FLAO|nr:universal stress protein [Flavobacterium magnum]AWA30928.1 hypothetical protein HYN48_13060 [Flavobacterium magnum]